jgi:hypothetical protein
MGGFVGARPREAFGAEVLAPTDFWTPSRGVPPRFVAEALRDCVESREQGGLEVSAFAEPTRASRAAYARLIGVDEGRVAMGNSVSSLLGPRGVAWISLNERVFEALVPAAIPFAGEDLWSTLYGLPLRLAASARRCDSSPAWFSALGAVRRYC